MSWWVVNLIVGFMYLYLSFKGTWACLKMRNKTQWIVMFTHLPCHILPFREDRTGNPCSDKAKCHVFRHISYIYISPKISPCSFSLFGHFLSQRRVFAVSWDVLSLHESPSKSKFHCISNCQVMLNHHVVRCSCWKLQVMQWKPSWDPTFAAILLHLGSWLKPETYLFKGWYIIKGCYKRYYYIYILLLGGEYIYICIYRYTYRCIYKYIYIFM